MIEWKWGKPLLENFSNEPQEGYIETAPDAGIPFRRMRFSDIMDIVNYSFYLSKQDYPAFMSWYRYDIRQGSIPFLFYDCRIGKQRIARIIGKPQYSANQTLRKLNITLAFEPLTVREDNALLITPEYVLNGYSLNITSSNPNLSIADDYNGGMGNALVNLEYELPFTGGVVDNNDCSYYILNGILYYDNNVSNGISQMLSKKVEGIDEFVTKVIGFSCKVYDAGVQGFWTKDALALTKSGKLYKVIENKATLLTSEYTFKDISGWDSYQWSTTVQYAQDSFGITYDNKLIDIKFKYGNNDYQITDISNNDTWKAVYSFGVSGNEQTFAVNTSNDLYYVSSSYNTNNFINLNYKISELYGFVFDFSYPRIYVKNTNDEVVEIISNIRWDRTSYNVLAIQGNWSKIYNNKVICDGKLYKFSNVSTSASATMAQISDVVGWSYLSAQYGICNNELYDVTSDTPVKISNYTDWDYVYGSNITYYPYMQSFGYAVRNNELYRINTYITSGVYVFELIGDIYGEGWYNNTEYVNPTEYFITIQGSPVLNDTITLDYNDDYTQVSGQYNLIVNDNDLLVVTTENRY